MSHAHQQKRILAISADRDFEQEIADNLTLQGYGISFVHSHGEALAALSRERVDIVLFDIESVAVQEMDIVNYVKTNLPGCEIVILTTIRELDEARNCLRNGASFYLIKPVGFMELKQLIDKLALQVEQQQENEDLQQQFLADLMAGSKAMEKVIRLAMKIAPTSSTVLVGGESGSGKEFLGRIVHRMSGRRADRFIPMNCGAVPDTLFESELFGHKKGAFTGADRDRQGLVEDAHTGTLFLDEVGELSAAAQVKLLRFIQERTFRRVGENALRTVDVRIIAATNKDLWSMVKDGRFREDLFYRLNVFYLVLPPLRERKETIPSLIRLFVHRYNELFNRGINRISKAAELILANYDYPGNVRELENIIEHAVVLADGAEINEKHLPEYMFRNRRLLAAPAAGICAEEICTLAEMEKHYIEQILGRLEYNYSETAKKLGISRSTLWRKIKTYKLAVPGEVPAR